MEVQVSKTPMCRVRCISLRLVRRLSRGRELAACVRCDTTELVEQEVRADG